MSHEVSVFYSSGNGIDKNSRNQASWLGKQDSDTFPQVTKDQPSKGQSRPPAAKSGRPPSHFGEELSRRRAAATPQISQKAVADAAGCSQGLISQLESGETQYPGVDVAIRIADFFGVSVYAMMPVENQRAEESLAAFLRTKLGKSLPGSMIEEMRSLTPRHGTPDEMYWIDLYRALSRLPEDGDETAVTPQTGAR